MALERTAPRGTAPPLAAYGAVWLLTLASVLVVQLARVMEFSALPFVGVLTLGTLFSAWVSRFPLSEGVRLMCGFGDGALALFCLIGQPLLNSLFGIGADAAVETYLSLAFLWYLCLRSPLMITMSALVFQSVPALALFGLVATYMLAAQILWLFVLMLLAMLFLMLASHRLEWARTHAVLETGYALRTVIATGVLTALMAFLAAPLLALTIGQFVSSVVVGMPFRAAMRAPTSQEMPPELQVGVGAVALSKQEILRVRIEGVAQPRYLRAESYNLYTGRGWNRGRVYYEDLLSLEQGVFVPMRAPQPPSEYLVTATIRLSSGWHRYLYAPGFPVRVEAPLRALQYAYYTDALVSYRPLGAGETYTVQAYLPPEEPAVLRQAPPLPSRFAFTMPPRPRRAGEPQPDPVRELVYRLTYNQPTQYDKVMALVRYIEQNTAYNLNVEPYPPEVDAVEYFLFEAKQGYCVEFATALAVMCQYAGIPARVTSGFILQERDPETGEYIVREEHRHLWTEVFFGREIGWVAFDATQNAPVIDAGTSAAQQADEATRQARREWLQRTLDLLIGAMALTILYLLIAPRLGWGERSAVSRPQRLYRRLVFALRLLGAPPPAVGQTPRAYLSQVADALQRQGSAAAPLLDALAPALTEYLYATPHSSAALEAQVAQQTRLLQRRALQELGARRLILRLLELGRQKVYGS